jgi:hypothetical protein
MLGKKEIHKHTTSFEKKIERIHSQNIRRKMKDGVIQTKANL